MLTKTVMPKTGIEPIDMESRKVENMTLPAISENDREDVINTINIYLKFLKPKYLNKIWYLAYKLMVDQIDEGKIKDDQSTKKLN